MWDAQGEITAFATEKQEQAIGKKGENPKEILMFEKKSHDRTEADKLGEFRSGGMHQRA